MQKISIALTETERQIYRRYLLLKYRDRETKRQEISIAFERDREIEDIYCCK